MDDNLLFTETQLNRSVTFREILETARTLWMGDNLDDEPTEYARGVTELIGRIALDDLNLGAGTSDNAITVAKHLGLVSPYIERSNS